uniref:GST C-terminal domain-containing protein n=1 Tax=Clastoptera arizonana TaxID=38151 RepID=A0A1B6CCR9_9HEMI
MFSHVIAPYLVTVYGKHMQSLYPSEPREKAIVDQRLYFDVGTLYARIRAIAFPVLFLGETTVSEDKKKSLEEALDWVDLFLKDGSWVAGSNLTIADTAFYASITGLVATGYDIKKHSPIVSWLERCKKEMKGVEENEEGAKLFGNAVSSKLKPGEL